MRGPVRTSTVEARCHPRLVFRMYMFQPFSPAENLLRVETEDLSCIFAEPYFVGRHLPIEGHNTAGPQRLLQSGLPLQNRRFMQPPLPKQSRNNQGAH